MKNKLTLTKQLSLAFIFFLSLLGSQAKAQDVECRISFGFDGGGNKYWGNFTDTHFGFSGDLFIRWNIEEWLSLHLMYNAGLLRYKAIPPEGALGTINTTRHGGWDLLASYNVFPE